MRSPVSRRDLLATLLSASAIPVQARPQTSSLAESRSYEQRFLFFDRDFSIERSDVQLVPAPLGKLGPLLQGDSPGDSLGASCAMSGNILRDDKGRYRIYYTGYADMDPNGGICMAESTDAQHWSKPQWSARSIRGNASNRIRLEGIPETAAAVQPIVLRLSDGRYRMYFWMHNQQPRLTRYLVAESADGLDWNVVNLDSPCLRHPSDIGAAEAKRIRSNDATMVYANAGGGYEMFSVWFLPNPPDSGRHVSRDNVPNSLRVIHRRTSEDGLKWSDPELTLVPDQDDAWDQQFYYLAQHHLDRWRVGFLGSYHAGEQTMDIEFAYSRDGGPWRRDLRRPWLPRGAPGSPDSKLVHMCSSLLDQGQSWLGLYTGSSFAHNYREQMRKNAIFGIRIPKYRLAGLASIGSSTARVRTEPFILRKPNLKFDASIRGSMRISVCDAFGKPLPGFESAQFVPLTGDSPAHDLRWKETTLANCQFEAISLRVEWVDGTIYGLVGSDH